MLKSPPRIKPHLLFAFCLSLTTVASAEIDVDSRLAGISSDQGGGAALKDPEIKKKVATLKRQYLGALAAKLKDPKLSEADKNAIKSEGRMLQFGGKIPAFDDPKTAKIVKTFRKTYRAQYAKLTGSDGSGNSRWRKRDGLHQLMQDLVVAGQFESTEKVAALLKIEDERYQDYKEVTDEQLEKAAANPPEGKLPEVSFPLSVPRPLKRPQREGRVIRIMPVAGEVKLLDQRAVEVGGAFFDDVYLSADGSLSGKGSSEIFKNIPQSGKYLTFANFNNKLAVAVREDSEFVFWGAPVYQRTCSDNFSGVSEPAKLFLNNLLCAVIDRKGSIHSWPVDPSRNDEIHLKAISRQRNVVDIAGNSRNYCMVLKSSGSIEVVCNITGLLSKEEERYVNSLSGIVKICSSQFSLTPESLALSATGKVYAWGWGESGKGKSPVPADLPGDIDDISITSHESVTFGAAHSMSRGWIIFGNQPVSFMPEQKERFKHAWGLQSMGKDWLALADIPEQNELTTDRMSLSGNTIYVSTGGKGATVTLDDAIDNLQRGDTLYLAPGTYPASTKGDRPGIAPPGDYAVVASNIRMKGNRSQIDASFHFSGANILVDGLKLKGLKHGNPSGIVIKNCIADWIDLAHDEHVVENSLVTGRLVLRDGGKYRNVTVVHDRNSMYGQSITAENCIFEGGDAFLFSIGDGSKGGKFTNCVIAPAAAFAQVSKNNAIVPKPDDAAPYGFIMENCIYKKPDFVDPGNLDYRLNPGSEVPEGIGANLDSDGWPIADERE